MSEGRSKLDGGASDGLVWNAGATRAGAISVHDLEGERVHWAVELAAAYMSPASTEWTTAKSASRASGCQGKRAVSKSERLRGC